MARWVLVFPLATDALLKGSLRADDKVIAVDAGLDALRAFDRAPDLVVGDLDSATPEAVAWAERLGVPFERHDAVKDETDGDLALRNVPDDAPVLFLGAGGGRPDHEAGNLHLLYRATLMREAEWLDDTTRRWFVLPGRPLTLDLAEGSVLSALPFAGPVTGVMYDSLAYPLVDARLEPGGTRGLSNVAGAPPQRISVAEGALLVIAPTRA